MWLGTISKVDFKQCCCTFSFTTLQQKRCIYILRLAANFDLVFPNHSYRSSMMIFYVNDAIFVLVNQYFLLLLGAIQSGAECSCIGYILLAISYLLILCTFPLSLCVCIKVVQEYERAVMFRLGRILSGGAKGPGMC